MVSALVFASALAVCAPSVSVPAPAADLQRLRPTLVVFLTIDQLHPDYLARYRSQLTGIS